MFRKQNQLDLTLKKNSYYVKLIKNSIVTVLLLSVTLTAMTTTRPFRWFMITVEEPNVDSNSYEIGPKPVDVGSLKTLDTEIGRKSRYSERCFSSVEQTDSSDKYFIEVSGLAIITQLKITFHDLR